MEGGRSSINHLDNQDSAASISARTDNTNLQQKTPTVKTFSELSNKIQKYAETIDNTQEENAEESVEKTSQDTKSEIPVVKGEIKSILGNKFTGGNIKLSQDFQHELIENGLENKKNLLPGETIVQTSNQGLYTPSPESSHFLTLRTDYIIGLTCNEKIVNMLSRS